MKKKVILSLSALFIVCITALFFFFYNRNRLFFPKENESGTSNDMTASLTSDILQMESATPDETALQSETTSQSKNETTLQNATTSPNKTTQSNTTTEPAPITHRFVFIADSRGNDNGVNKPALTKILQLIKGLSPQPEYIITGGDLVGGADSDSAFLSQLQNYKNIVTAYYPMSMILPGFGNHEDDGSADDSHDKLFQDFFSGFPETSALGSYDNTAYYFDVGNVRLIMLNSDYGNELHEITGGQLDWLNNCTKAGNQMIKFIFVHEPAYPTGANIGFSLDVHPAQRDSFWQTIDQNNIMALFCAHEHNYTRRCIDSSFDPQFKRAVYQITAGTAGAPVYTQYISKKGVVVPPNPVYHFVVIDVGNSTTTVTAISIDSKVIDKFTLNNIS